jgi:hypothetical protein
LGEQLGGPVEADVAKLRMVGRFRPRMFAGDAKHRSHAVIPKRHERARMFAAGTGDVHEAFDECVLADRVSHLDTSESSSEESAGSRMAQERGYIKCSTGVRDVRRLRGVSALRAQPIPNLDG